MPVTFDIYPEFIETKMHRVDTIDRAYEEKLMEAMRRNILVGLELMQDEMKRLKRH